MTARALWVPGDFPGTNKLLDLVRSSGYYAGVAVATRSRQKERFGYRSAAGRIRHLVSTRALERKLAPVLAPVGLWFALLPSGRTNDPSAWYLAAKAAEDGLVDARVIPSDRSHVAWTGGRCVREPEELRAGIVVAGAPFTGRPGLLIEFRTAGTEVDPRGWF